MPFWDWKKLDEDAKKEREEMERRQRTTSGKQAREGFTRDKSGRLVRTEKSAEAAKKSGAIGSTRERELEKRGEGRHTSAINITHDQLINAAVSELNNKGTMLGFWDYVKDLAADAIGQDWRYTGEMERPEKWTDSYIERWLTQNVLEIWRRTHILKDQMDAEEFKQRYLNFSEYAFKERKQRRDLGKPKSYKRVAAEGAAIGVGSLAVIEGAKSAKLKKLARRGSKVLKGVGRTLYSQESDDIHDFAIGSGIQMIKKTARAGASLVKKKKRGPQIYHPIKKPSLKARAKKVQGKAGEVKERVSANIGERRRQQMLKKKQIYHPIKKSKRFSEFDEVDHDRSSRNFLSSYLGLHEPNEFQVNKLSGLFKSRDFLKSQITDQGTNGALYNGIAQLNTEINELLQTNDFSESEFSTNPLKLVGKVGTLRKIAKRKKRKLNIAPIDSNSPTLSASVRPDPKKAWSDKLKKDIRKKRSYSDISDDLHEYFVGAAVGIASGVASAVGGLAKKKKKRPRNSQMGTTPFQG